MPSMFGRARTSSTPAQPSPPPLRAFTDEFGRVPSRSGGGAPPTPRKDAKYSTLSPSSKTRKKDKDTPFDEQESYESSLRLDDAGFYPFTSLPPVLTSGTSSFGGSPGVEDVPYGHLAYKREVVLSIFQVTLLVEDIAAELTSRGLQVPFLFSSQAIDLNPGAVKRLIDSFLATCMTGGSREKWLEDKKFAGAHELGMVLRWGLARVMRRGERRGILEFEGYLAWRDSEEAQNYPPEHISLWTGSLPPSLIQPVSTLFSLLSMLISHAHTSGLTPSALASLFGPLLFGLSLSASMSEWPIQDDQPSPGSPNPNVSGGFGAGMTSSGGASFHQVHETYLANTNGFEHLLLAYIRMRAKTTPGGIPPRLANWIKGYPGSILPGGPYTSSGFAGGSEIGHGGGMGGGGASRREDLYKPRKGAKMLRALAVRRNVRVYSSDLVRSCASWASKGGGVNALVNTREWSKVVPFSTPLPSTPGGSGSSGSKLDPRYADGYRKRMNLSSGFYPISTPFVVSTTAAAQPSRSSLSMSSTLSPNHHSQSLSLSPSHALGTNGRPLSRSTTSLSTSLLDENEELRFNSLVDLRWAAFENIGFEDDGARLDKALALDLNESARRTLPPQREAITWADFSASGFLRDPASASVSSHGHSAPGSPEPRKSGTGNWSLDGALQFDNTLIQGVRENERAVEDMSKKLKKSSKTLPAFGWDTSPVTSEELIEEGFLACFCDLIYGGGVGWMDRGERFLRSSSWGLVEFKSVPSSSTSPSSPQNTINRNYSTSAGTSSPHPSSSSDPRTSSTLFLFEEFVPAEYRALLVNPKQKSRFPLLPSPLAATLGKGKSKKVWKQAATLNGVPYILGQVPTTSTATLLGGRGKKEREREFEGLLDGEKSGMTLRIAADGTRSEAAKGLPDPVENLAHLSSSTITGGKGSKQVGGGTGTTRKGVSSPLYTGDQEQDEAYPRPMDRAPTFPLSIMSTSEAMPRPGDEAGEVTPTARKSRFRLGVVGLGVRRKDKGAKNGHGGRGLTMDDLDTLDFETRTTGSFDSGSNGPTPPGTERRSRHERGQSKDDTWVDILVSSNSRRMAGQDAVMDGQRRRTADPEMMMSASLEDPDISGTGMSHGEQRRGGVFEYDHGHDPTPGDDDDDENQVDRYSRGDDDEDIQEVDYAPSKQKAALYQHQQHHYRGRRSRSQDPDDIGDISSEDEQDAVKRFPSVPDSEGSSQQRPLPSTPSPARKAGSSGVSALIEKYASLDRSSPGIIAASPSPSRLPVRSSSKELPTPSGSSSSAATSSRDAPLPQPPTEEPEQHTTHEFPRPLSGDMTPALQSKPPVEPPKEPTGAVAADRALTPSPMGGLNRYVHGAPLHNLPEDPEEEG